MAGFWKSARESPRPEANRLVDEDEVYLGGGNAYSTLTAGQYGFRDSGYVGYGQIGEVIPAMQAAVNLLATTMACLPRTVVDGAGREVASDVGLLINHSDRRWPAVYVWEYLYRSALTWGVGYAWVPRIPAMGGRMRIYPCDPVRSHVQVSEDNRRLTYQLQPLVGPVRYAVPSQDVLVIVGDGYNGLRGLSPLWAYSLTTGVLSHSMRHLLGTLRNGLHISGVVESDIEVGQGAGWDLPRIQELRRRLAEQFAGSRTAGQVPVLPPGFSWKGMPFNAVDIELVKLLDLSITDVCRIYRVPPRKIYHAGSGGGGVRDTTNVEMSEYDWAESLTMRAEMLGEMVSSQLLSAESLTMGRRVRFDTRRLFAGTVSQRIAAMDQGVARGMLVTPNEGREYIETGVLPALGPIEGGDDLISPKGAPDAGQGESTAGQETAPAEPDD